MSTLTEVRPSENLVEAAASVLEDVFAALRADNRNNEPGTLLKAGVLSSRLAALQALDGPGSDAKREALAVDLLIAIGAAFPAISKWKASRADEDNHLRYEALGKAAIEEANA